MADYLFRARTNEGYLFKVLAELLLQNVQTACFVLNDEGISLRMTDNLKKTLLDINLDSNTFQVYKYKYNTSKMPEGVKATFSRQSPAGVESSLPSWRPSSAPVAFLRYTISCVS